MGGVFSGGKFNCALLVILVVGLGACGGGKGKSSAPDTAAPSAQIMFPTAVSMTEDNSILVRGTASDSGSAIVSVKVNNIEATTSDNYASWQVRVPLALGANKLSVTTTDSLQNTNGRAAEASITSTATIKSSSCTTSANLANVEDGSKIIIAADTVNNRCVALPNSSGVSAENLSDPFSVVVDKAHNRVLRLFSETIVGIDLTTGAQTPLTTSDTASNFPMRFAEVRDFALDLQRNRVLAVNTGAVFAIDLNSGELTLVADESGLEGVSLSEISSIVLDNSNRAIISTRLKLIAMDLDSFAFTLLPAASGSTKPVALDLDRGRVLVLDTYSGALEAVNLTTGNRAPLSAANLFVNPSSVIVDAANNRALVIDYRGTSVAVAVDLTSGANTPLLPGEYSTPDKANGFEYPASIALDASRNRVLVVDAALKAIVAVDLNTGKRSIMSDSATPNAENPFQNPGDIVVDEERNRALVIDYELQTVIAVNLASGARTGVSRNWPAGWSNFYPESIMLDTAHNRALIAGPSILLAMDLSSGAITHFAGGSFAGAAIDVAGNRLLRINRSSIESTEMLATDLTSGETQPLFPLAYLDAINVIPYPGRAVFDNASKRMLVTNLGNLHPAAVVAIDPSTGSAVRLQPSNPAAEAINAFGSPWSIVIDSAHDRALVTDSTRKSIFAVDLMTGERVIFSK